jgi:spore coat polysaccharide biosynthesis predicted glycosyltransferase SpsG
MSGANPKTLSHNASVVKIYSATNSMARLTKKNIFLVCKNTLAYYNTGVIAVNSKVVGWAPDDFFYHTLSSLNHNFSISE